MSKKQVPYSSNGAGRVDIVTQQFMLPKPVPATPKK